MSEQILLIDQGNTRLKWVWVNDGEIDENSGGHGDLFVLGETMRSVSVFRPARITVKPLISGVQTAIVVGPSGEEIYTDEYGRVKVQFFWDREGEANENSSMLPGPLLVIAALTFSGVSSYWINVI